VRSKKREGGINGRSPREEQKERKLASAHPADHVPGCRRLVWGERKMRGESPKGFSVSLGVGVRRPGGVEGFGP